MDNYLVFIALAGAVILMTAWLPMALKTLPLSLPIACIATGVIFALAPMDITGFGNPLESLVFTERLTEFVVIIALMGAGLKLDRPLSFGRWMLTWRLLAISMPLTIGAIALLGSGVLGLGLASAILLGAALAPTDPVLASDIQVGPPNGKEEDEVRFALTSEAGLNDALAFPFVHLAIAIALSQVSGGSWLGDWLLLDVVWKLAVGLSLGWLTGKILGFLTFSLPRYARLARSGDGFVAIGITCLCYGVTEMAHGYGFLAVFVAALTLRASERRHSYHEDLHSFTEQIERLLMMALLVCFGAAIAQGSIFDGLTWNAVAVALLILLVVRPLAGAIGLIGSRQPIEEKAVIAFFGIRGLGSFYYLAYALRQTDFAGAETLWTVVCLVVLMSIVMHGVAVTPVMRLLDRRRPAPAPEPDTAAVS